MNEKKNEIFNNNMASKIVQNSPQQTLTNSPQEPTTSLATTNEAEQLSSCDICELNFRNAHLRDMHFNLVHQNSPNVTIAAATTKALITDTPATAVVEHDFKCHLCAKTYKTKGSLRVHLKVVHMLGLANVNNTTKLNICDRIRHKEAKVQKSNNVNTKATTQHYNKPIVPSNSPTLTSRNSPQMQHFMFLNHLQQVKSENELLSNVPLAQINGNSMQTFDANLLHTNLLSVYSTPTPAGELSKDLLNKPALENPKIWECDVCSKSFTTKYFLKKHKRLHTGEMPYTCDICARTFTFQQSYHKHLLYHSDEKPHICATCGRAFKEVSTLHNHERIHSGEKPFKCEICGKCFRQRVSFLVHTRIHTGVMPYKCEQCQKNFRYKVSLRTHKCTQASEISTEALENTPHQAGSPQLQNHAIKEEQNSKCEASKIYAQQNSPASLEIAAINQQLNNSTDCVEALLSKTIDDIVVESCQKMGIGNDDINGVLNNNLMINSSPQVQFTHSPATLNGFNEGSSSPLQKLQEMRLYSPKFDEVEETTTINNNVNDFSQLFFK